MGFFTLLKLFLGFDGSWASVIFLPCSVLVVTLFLSGLSLDLERVLESVVAFVDLIGLESLVWFLVDNFEVISLVCFLVGSFFFVSVSSLFIEKLGFPSAVVRINGVDFEEDNVEELRRRDF